MFAILIIVEIYSCLYYDIAKTSSNKNVPQNGSQIKSVPQVPQMGHRWGTKSGSPLHLVVPKIVSLQIVDSIYFLPSKAAFLCLFIGIL